MGIFSKKRICPVCNKSNEVRFGAAGDPAGGMLVVLADCRNCDYIFIFGFVSLLIFISGIFFMIMIMVFFEEYFFNGIVFIITILMIFILPILLMLLFVKSPLFNKYINWYIKRKARNMIEKRYIQDRWGNTFKNSIKYKYSIKNKKFYLK